MIFPPPSRTVQIVPQTMWDELGSGRFRPANKVKGGPVGIVAWPR
jgi:hypothetical protein